MMTSNTKSLLLVFLAAVMMLGLIAMAAAKSGPAAKGDASSFTALLPVLKHPRCMNCHSTGDFPRQGDDGHQHAMDVRRGAEGHGVTAENAAPVIRTTILTVPIFLLARPIGVCLRPTFQ